jgi:hypothetical protein
LALFAIALPYAASAQIPGLSILDNVTQGFVSGFVFIVSWILALIAGVVIAIESWFLQVILSISFNLVNAAPVKIGFPIVLSFANLFFVGGLIVIAIATIIRREEYGMKKILWKLVVMAVVVNFGLVICGALLRVSDETTKFFIESISPGSSGEDGTTNFTGFASSLAGAFNPKAVILSSNDVVQNPALAKQDLSSWAVAGDNVGNMIKPIVGVLSTIGTFVIIIITLGTLIGMLLWRYIRVGMALIVLPLAWAAWIFPAYHEHYKKWWTKFTQWTIFPPVVVFFIWLGLKISEVMSQSTGEYRALYQSESGNPVSDFLGNLFTPIITDTLKSFILFGIMMGGMVAAQDLGVKFADAGYKAIEGAGGWAKNKAMYYSKRGARAGGQALDRGAGKLARLQREGKGVGVTEWLAKSKSPLLAKGGRALQGLAAKGGSDVVTEAGKALHATNDAERVALLKTGLEMPEILALLSMGLTHKVLEALQGKTTMDDAVASAMRDGDAEALSGLLKNKAAGVEGAMLDRLQQALVKGIDQAFSPDQFSDFTKGLSREQKDNLLKAMKAVINPPGTSKQQALQNAIQYIGLDKMNVIRNNGPMQDRGITSEMWQEPRKPPANQQPIGGRQRQQPAQQQAPAAAPAPAPAPAPRGGGGHGGGGGGGGGAAPAAPTGGGGHP